MSAQATPKLQFKKRSSDPTSGATMASTIKLSKKITEKNPLVATLDNLEHTVSEAKAEIASTSTSASAKKPRAKSSKAQASSGAIMPLVFIDASYFIFYRYHATKVWYQHSKKDDDGVEFNIENAGFVENYSKHFRQWTAKISKQFGVPESQFFWFKDSPKDSLWRTPLFPKYKASRDAKCPEGIDGFFGHTFDNLIPKDRQMIVPGAEADDIAAVATLYENTNHPTQPIIIITTDTDYLQLVNDTTRVVKLPNFDDIPLVVKSGKDKVKVTAKEYLMAKVILGDTADEIPKVYDGCGPVTAINISRNPDAFKKLIQDHPERLKKYQHNLTLISFNEIPAEIQQKCQTAYLQVRNL